MALFDWAKTKPKCKHDWEDISHTWIENIIKDNHLRIIGKYKSHYDGYGFNSSWTAIRMELDGEDYLLYDSDFWPKRRVEQKVCLKCGLCIDEVEEAINAVNLALRNKQNELHADLARHNLAKRMWANCKEG